MDIQQLAIEYDKDSAIMSGYADGNAEAFSKWISLYWIEGNKPRFLVPPGQAPDAVSIAQGDNSPCRVDWYRLKDGRVVGVGPYSNKPTTVDSFDVDCGFIFPADVGEIQTVEDYRVPVIPGR